MRMLAVNGYVFVLVALVFGLFNQVRVGPIVGVGDDMWAPNVTNAGASCGFAVAAGLCFLGYAILASRRTE